MSELELKKLETLLLAMLKELHFITREILDAMKNRALEGTDPPG
jgi:hypothetical protein